MSEKLVKVSLTTDENGMIGRQCPSPDCGQYFKLKLGTGLPTTMTSCPYCGWNGESSDFTTQDQLEYAKSVAIKQTLDPMLRDFKRSVEGLNKPIRNSLIQLKFSVTTPTFRLHHYMEKDVETQITCDSCGLEFSVFGVFASCPDCQKLNTFSVLRSSLEVCRKRLLLAEHKDTASDSELKDAIIQDSLSSAIAAFDALGKKLRELRPDIFPKSPRNLFQNYHALNKCLTTRTGRGIEDRIGQQAAADLLRLLQVRHLFEHNLGVVDQDFIKNVPTHSHSLGRKYPLSHQDVERLIELLITLTESINSELYSQQ